MVDIFSFGPPNNHFKTSFFTLKFSLLVLIIQKFEYRKFSRCQRVPKEKLSQCQPNKYLFIGSFSFLLTHCTIFLYTVEPFFEMIENGDNAQ